VSDEADWGMWDWAMEIAAAYGLPEDEENSEQNIQDDETAP